MKKTLLIITMALTTLVNAFTYQGELSQTGSLVTGTADIKFSLHNAGTGGSMVGGVDLHTAVVISNGRFVADLDQWVALYDGTPLWLEIEVDIGSTGNFTKLSPRQKLQPSPYAEYAYDVAGGSNGDITGVVAGTGLTGGGASGEITINVDTAVIQNRVTGSCLAGESIRTINQDGTVVCEADDAIDAATVWSTTGNSGTSSTTDFLGTTDEQNLAVKVGDKRVMLYESQSSVLTPNIIGGHSGNIMTGATRHGSIIAGGGSSAATSCGINNDQPCINQSSNNFTTISGGRGNNVIEAGGVVAGGYNNIIDILAYRGVISGGEDNILTGAYAAIPGGARNRAGGKYSWAGGAGAVVNTGDDGTFIWDGGGSSFYKLTSSGESQFLVRAPGGMWLGTRGTDLVPNLLNSAFIVEASGSKDLMRLKIDSNTKLIVSNNGGTSIGSNTAADANGLRVLGETNLMDRLGVGTTSPAAQIDVSAPNGMDAVHVRVNSLSKLIVKSNGGTTIGSISSPATNGLRVEGETNLMDVVGVGTTTPNSTFHIDSPNGDIPFRVQISGTTKLKVESNGGVAIGSNYDPVPANGLKVKGDVEILGSLSKGGGSFKIDHPLDPENKFLYHSFVESPDMMNIYNGNIITDKNGVAWVEMPDWFEALNMDFRYQLTVIGSFNRAMIAEEIVDNRFMIRTETGLVKVSWQVTGVRHDVWAEKNRIPVEEEKTEQDKGSYLHPKAWNVDKKLAIGYSEE